MKKNGLKIVSVSLLVIFALIIVSLVSYIFELQDKLNIMKNELARREIKEDSIIIKIPSGERRVRINNLNYINIVRRCLCYHLKDGAMFDG